MQEAMIGTAPCNWNNDDVPDYRPPTPYSQMLDEMAAAGYAGTEVGGSFPTNTQKIKEDLAARGLTAASTFCSVNLREPALRAGEIDRAVERAAFVAALGTDVLIVADSGDDCRRAVAGRVSPEDGLDADAWQSLTTGLHILADRCHALGVSLVFHNHVGTYVESEAELRRLLDGSDASYLGLCYDVGHMLYAGGDVLGMAERYSARIRYLHLKDVDMAVLAHCRSQARGFHEALRLGIFTEFGNGGLDFRRLFAALESIAYQGWIIVEQDTTKKTPLESAIVNRRYLRENFGV